MYPCYDEDKNLATINLWVKKNDFTESKTRITCSIISIIRMKINYCQFF